MTATKRPSSFSTSYVAGMGALACLAAISGLILTGERHTGFLGLIEIPVLVACVLLLVEASIHGARNPGSGWPLLAASAATILSAVLLFLTATSPHPGGAVFMELAAAIDGFLLMVVLAKFRNVMKSQPTV